MKQLSVPTIRDRTIPSFWDLFKIYEHVARSFHTNHALLVDFGRCDFIPQNGVAFLGGLFDLARQNGVDVRVNWDTIKPHVREHLTNNGFIKAMGGWERGYKKNTIPYRYDLVLDKEVLMSYLMQDWLGRDWISLSPTLKHHIVGNACEIYANAFDHSASTVGVHSCGQYYPNLRELCLSVVDFGIGIADNVRRFHSDSCISDSDALEWAFQKGNTTLLGSNIGRGMGLGLLRNFVQTNQGKIMIFANRGYGIITAEKEAFGSMPYEFSGTFVNISFKCDEHYYKLASEAEDTLLFSL